MSDETKGPDAPLPSHFPIHPEWVAGYREAALKPDLPIIDPHHHLWDRGERYLVWELAEEIAASGHDIRATVAVECHSMYRTEGPAEEAPLGETEFLNGMAAISAGGMAGPVRIAAGIIGYVDLALGERVRPLLEAHVAAAGGRLKGVRNSSVWHPDPRARASLASPPPGLLNDPSFRRGFAALAPLGLSFDGWMYHSQLGELLELARAFPGTSIVIDHVGGANALGPYAGRRQEVLAEWGASMRALARCPNVTVKIGGMGMRLFAFGYGYGERDAPPTSEELARAWRPYAETCIEAFGPGRCMFESNFPVDKGCAAYGVVWNAFKRLTAGAGADDRHALFAGTAARVYRLEGALERRP